MRRVDEDERGAVRADQRGDAIVVLLPHLVGHHGFDRGARDLQREVEGAAMAFVDDLDVGTGPEPARHVVDRLLRRGESEAQERRLRYRL